MNEMNTRRALKRKRINNNKTKEVKDRLKLIR